MAQANRNSTGFATGLSSLIRDPIVRAAFQRAERDYGQSFAIPNDRPKVLVGDAAERVRDRAVAS
jgi:hypothetical protein